MKDGAILSDFKGVLQTELYARYNTVCLPDKAVRAGCWARVRRKFIELEKIAGKDVWGAREIRSSSIKQSRRNVTQKRL